MKLGELTLPTNAEAERMILGCVLLNNSVIDQMTEAITVQDFSSAAHRKIAQAMIDLHAANGAIDPVTLQEELRTQGNLDSVGGAAYIATLFDGVPRFQNISEYTQVVRTIAIRRRMIYFGDWLMKVAAAEDCNVTELITTMNAKVDEIGDEQIISPLISAATAVERTALALEQSWEQPDGLMGLRTTYGDLDTGIRGFKGGKLYLIAAPPGMGKTTLAQNLAYGFAQQSSAVGLFVSLEMSADELSLRALSTFSQLDSDRLQSGQLNETEKAQFRKAREVLKQVPLEYLENPDQITPSKIRALARRVKRLHGRCDFIILDYLQLAEADGVKPHDNDTIRLGKISRALKMQSLALNIPVIVLSQLNREYGRRGWEVEPNLTDLRGSGSLEQDSDVVAFLWPVDGNNEADNRRHLLIRKQRGGKKDIRIPLVFRGDISCFLPAEKQAFYGNETGIAPIIERGNGRRREAESIYGGGSRKPSTSQASEFLDYEAF